MFTERVPAACLFLGENHCVATPSLIRNTEDLSIIPLRMRTAILSVCPLPTVWIACRHPRLSRVESSQGEP